MVYLALIMYYVYALKSIKNNDLYIGYSEDLRQRFKDHNQGNVKATRDNRPWKLVYFEAYCDKRDGTKRERQLKNHRAKLDLKEQLRYSLG